MDAHSHTGISVRIWCVQSYDVACKVCMCVYEGFVLAFKNATCALFLLNTCVTAAVCHKKFLRKYLKRTTQSTLTSLKCQAVALSRISSFFPGPMWDEQAFFFVQRFHGCTRIQGSVKTLAKRSEDGAFPLGLLVLSYQEIFFM
jgi:hypothetical protein